MPLTCAFGAPRRIRTPNRQIRSLVLSVGLIGSRRIWAARVGWLVGPDGSRRIQKDRLDDQMDDQGEQLLWWPPIPASGGWSLGLLLRVGGGALGLLGLGTGRPGPPARRRLAGGDLAGHLGKLASRGPDRPAQTGERLLLVQAFAFHQPPLARSINPRIHGDPELLGQGALELGLGRGSEQAGHHPGIGLQSADLGVVPLPWVHRVQIQGPDRATTQLDWDTQPRADLDLDKGQSDLAPALLQGRVLHHRRPAAGVRLQAGAGGEDLLVVLQGLGALVRGAGPAQLAIQVGQHDSGGVGVEQLLGCDDGLVQGGGQVLRGGQGGQGADALGQHGGVDRHERVPLGPVAELANPVNRPGTMMAWGADQALQPHEIVWALRRFVSSTGQESALPPYAPASRADTATRTGCGTTWGWSAGAGLRHHWLLRPLTSLGGSVPGCRRGWTQIPSACVSWPEQPSTPGRAPAVYKTGADRPRRTGEYCPAAQLGVVVQPVRSRRVE